MKLQNLPEKQKSWLLLGTLMLGILAVYLINATKSGLWYDEAIEYFFQSIQMDPSLVAVQLVICTKESLQHISRHCITG